MKYGFQRVFKEECRALIRAPKRLFYVLVFPLILFGFLSAIFIEGVPRDLPIAYLDQDQSKMSTQLVRMIDSSPSIAMATKVLNEAEAQQFIQQNKIYGFVVIPKDFQKSIYKGVPSEVVCYTNNQFLLPAGLIQKDFQQIIGTFSAGVAMNKSMQQGNQGELAYANQLPVRTDIHALFNPYVNYAYYLLTALLPMMLQMIAMMITVYVIGIPLKYRTGEYWLKLAGGSAWSALWGKLLPYTICLAFVSWWMNYLLFELIGVPLRTSMLSVTLITFLLTFIYQLLGVSIISISKDLRTAMTMGSGFTAIAMSFAVYTFPIEGLPKSMQYLAEIFPFKHYMEYFVNRAIRGIPLSWTIEPMLVLAGFAFIFVLTFPLFVKLIKKGGYEQV
ncbi:ABC transporter permease [Flavobacteriaceae bacterium Ap0902]|nr:ABC transporter permease [Flavobacteriaceae bacterium Ap0902]